MDLSVVFGRDLHERAHAIVVGRHTIIFTPFVIHAASPHAR